MATQIEMKKMDTGRPESEEEIYQFKEVNWKRVLTNPKNIPWWILAIVVVALVTLITIHHDKIVEALRPVSETLRDTPGGFVIPAIILVVISFPPLFGHEIIALLCGVVYGLWIGFAIVAAGTFLGEIGTWYAFKYAFRKRAVKLERTNLNYSALARLTRDGGFLVVLIVRLSAVPSHFSTAVFSTCDVKFWHFAVATILTLPKQITIVYLGVLLVQQTKNSKISAIVLVASSIATMVAAVYIYLKMRRTKAILLREQEERMASRKENSYDEDFGLTADGQVDMKYNQRPSL